MAEALTDAYADDATAIAVADRQPALDELLAAHRLWAEWLATGRVRKFARRGGAADPISAGDRTESSVMTFRTESRIPIAGSVDDVWAYLCDVGRWSEWAPTVLEARIAGGAPLQPGARVEQRAKGILGTSRHRSQKVTAVEAPHRMAFAGPLGTSAARWGMELEPLDNRQTDAVMWIEVDLQGVMRAIPTGMLKGRIQRVSDLEMTLIKAAVEAGTAS